MATWTQVPNRVSASRAAVSFSTSKMNSENSSVLMSNDLQPTKSGVKTGYDGINGQISQIPGLSPTVSSVYEEKVRGRRTGVLDSDSDYVKLAKQGGHKGLLWHEESFTSQPNSYRPPSWFCTSSGDNIKPKKFNTDLTEKHCPSLITIEEKKNPGAFQRMEPPFGTDNMSTWERDDSSNGEEKNNNVRNNQMENLQSSNQHHETSKFKRIYVLGHFAFDGELIVEKQTGNKCRERERVFDKKPAPVDMSKLLSFGYADDNKPTANAFVSN